MKKTIAALAAVAALLLPTAIASGGAKYKMKDLEALAESESWLELLAHAMDIAPSDRDEDWRKLVEKAASGRLDELQDDDLKYLSSIKQTIESDKKVFPFLKKSKTYSRAANKATVKTLKGCYFSRECKRGNDPDWLNLVRETVEAEASDRASACEAGEMVASFMVAYTALPMFKVAVAGKDGLACCKQDALKKAVAAGYKEPSYESLAGEVGKVCKIAKPK